MPVENLTTQIPTSLLQRTYLEENSQPCTPQHSLIPNIIANESTSNVCNIFSRTTTPSDVEFQEPDLDNTDAIHTETSFNLPQNDEIESPNRHELRKRAAESLSIQGEYMKKRARRIDGIAELDIGTIVQVSVKDIDRARTDPNNATLVVVDKISGKHSTFEKYKLACRAGVLNTIYDRSELSPCLNVEPAAMGLLYTLENWRGLPRCGIRAAMRTVSMMGGQGMLRYNCKKSCNTKKCKCYQSGRVCNSRCHKRNNRCKNHD